MPSFILPNAALILLAFPVPAVVFVPYFAGIVILVLGLIVVSRELPQARGMEKVLLFGPVLFATPIAVFGGEHLSIAKAIAQAVPSWIPGHLFWAYFVGVALIAAALSIVLNRFSGLASTLLGIMLFCFVLLIHTPRLAANPSDRIATAVLLRDMAFSAGAFALAATRANEAWRPYASRISAIARYVVSIALLYFGVQHFLHPGFVPVVPLALAMPAYIPLHSFWTYAVGAALLASGLALLINWSARIAATWMALVVFAIVLIVYLPILVADPADIGTAVNYFADTLMVCGALLLLGAAMPKSPVLLQSA